MVIEDPLSSRVLHNNSLIRKIYFLYSEPLRETVHYNIVEGKCVQRGYLFSCRSAKHYLCLLVRWVEDKAAGQPRLVWDAFHYYR